MTISAEELLKAAEDEYKYSGVLSEDAFAFDMSLVSKRERILKETDVHADNAMMFQLRECLRARPGYQRPCTPAQERRVLLKHLVFLDFADIFKDNKKQPKKEGAPNLLEYLFLHGFTLIFENEEMISYMPFDKSASMSRNCRMSFVDRSLLEASFDLANIEKRVTLDIDFTAFNVIPSKYFAYRGLYFTDAQRIPGSDEFPLNEETVIVLREDTPEGGYVNHTLKKKKVITYDEDIFKAQETKGMVCGVEKTIDELKVQSFDGEGIISPHYAKWINECLSGHKGTHVQEATSFQIRMPFAKGMLHRVDFHEFMKEFTRRDDLKIEDAFGKMRDLSKAQIILTTSMFKCHRWLRKYADAAKIEDPMKFYFGSFHKYSHALYIGNTNLNNPYKDTVKINYQFLNTLDMDADTVKELVREQAARSDDILKDPQGEGRRRLLELPEADLTDADTGAAVPEETVRIQPRQAWKYALQENKAFAQDQFIRERMRQESFAMLSDIAQGKLEVSGALEYLSDDLFALLIYMIRITDLEKEKKDALTGMLRRYTLHSGKFYLADAKDIKLQDGQYYTIWRSPHLSRNEQCALRPYLPGADKRNKIAQTQGGGPADVYDKYFSHLKGVLMVAFSSDAALTLGGADYDGDYVKIITDPRFTDAVLRGAYRKEEKGRYVRKLPIPYIASPAGIAGTLQSPIIFDTAKEPRSNTAYYEMVYRLALDTFENRIGLISNEAIESGRQEYFGPPKVRDEWKGSSALATVLTGLEIDAVKTGIHPKMAQAAVKTKAKSAGGDYYRRIRDYMRQSDLCSVSFEKTQKGLRVSGFSNGLKPLTVSGDEYEGVVHSNIDYLPYYCLEALFQRKEGKKELKRQIVKKEPQFYFESGLIHIQPPEPEKEEELEKLIRTYKRFKKKVAELNWTRNNAKTSPAIRYAHNILRKCYDYSCDTLCGTDWDIETAMECVCEELSRVLPDEAKANEARKRYGEYKHAYAIAPAEKWPEVIANILEIDDTYDLLEPAYLLMLEPTKEGYSILYYLIYALCSEYAAGRMPDLETEEKEDAQPGLYDKALYQDMMRIYIAAHTDRKPERVWMEDIRQMCVEQMRKIFNGDMNEALRCAHLLRPCADKSGSFFWTMFDTDLAAENLYYPERGEEEYVR